MNFRLSLLISAFLYLSAHSQSRYVDSILYILKTQPEDSMKVKFLQKLWVHYLNNDPQKSVEYASEGLYIAKKIKWDRGIAASYSGISNAYFNLGDYQNSLKYRLEELDFSKKIKYNDDVCEVLYSMGACYSNLGKPTEAMKMYIEALTLADAAKDTVRQVDILTNIGSLYGERSDTLKALKYFEKALELSERHHLKIAFAENLMNVANIYCDKGQITRAQNMYLRALHILQNLDQNSATIFLLFNIGSTYELQADSALNAGNKELKDKYLAKCILFCDSAMGKAKRMGNTFMISHMLNGRGTTIGLLRKDYREAFRNLDESMKLAVELGATGIIINNHKSYYRLLKQKGEFERALLHYERFTAMNDSINSLANKKSLAELQIKYDTEKKDAENKTLAQQNRILELSLTNNRYLNYGIGILMAVMLSFGFLAFRQQRSRSQQKYTVLQQKLLQSQMDPHFIFNSLTAIESYIYEHQPKEAGNYLAQFSRLMRLMLENSSNDRISLATETEMLEYYLALQKLRLNDKLKYSIKIEENINPQNIMLPPMLLQPFVENVIEHGFRGLAQEGEVNIQFSLSGNELQASITDNGIGYYQSQQQKDRFCTHKSMAIEITQQRLKYLNRRRFSKFSLNIREIDPEKTNKGTEVLFTIPV
jgi:tetratricopeptide (TPR) repeat protein